MTDERPPKVTVLLATYNHEQWVNQALDSVLMQETDFAVETVVIEDCSTDRTREIVMRYAEKYPDRITLMLAERNYNSNVVWSQALRDARAPYVVSLDGDDYWTSPHKLSRQVRFMEEHPDCSLSYHDATCVFVESGETYNYNPLDQKEVSTVEDLLAANFVPTVGAMFSKRLIDPVPAWVGNVRWGDWGINLHAACHGTVRYINEVMAVYRIHRDGAWSGLSEIQQTEGNLECYEQMNANLQYKYDALIKAQIAETRRLLAQLRGKSHTQAKT
jgi:glycosyltransferase involved in cell wall biosynthesis